MIYDVAIKRRGISALFDLKGKAEDFAPVLSTLGLAFPETANTSARAGERELYWIGVDHWLLRAPLEEEQDLEEIFDAAPGAENASIVPISDTLALFEVSGPDARQILAIASPLDCHPSVFPENGVTYTEAFGLKALVIRRDSGFELAVDQSFGPMVADYLDRATAA